jgi:pimeloyl-ACP methyl ester carboxylesterase
LLVLLIGGCATPFSAVSVDPLRTDASAGWDPGEIGRDTQAILDAHDWGVAWRSSPTSALAALEPDAADPRVRRAMVETALAAAIERQLRGDRLQECDGLYLCAAELSAGLKDSHGDTHGGFADRASRFALSRLLDRHGQGLWDSRWPAPTRLQGPLRRYQWVREPGPHTTPGAGPWRRVVPVDRYRVHQGPAIPSIPGLGAACVGKVSRNGGPSGSGDGPGLPEGSWQSLTLTAEFGPEAPIRSIVFRVHDRKRTETVESGGRARGLAGDFVTPFAVRTRELDQKNLLSLGLLGFFRGDRFSDDTGLHPLETPVTDKIPVVFVHGLLSEPNTWRHLHAALLADPEIRQRYQFLAFQYPSSTPVQWSSTRLRQSLAEWRRRMDPEGVHTNLHRMVLVGHSMGGLLSRMQVVRGGPGLYRRYFTRSIDELSLAEPQRRMLRDMFFFEPNPHVERVIFICVPHGGSPMATDWPGRVARYLARLPITALEVTSDLVTFNRDALTLRGRIAPGSSIDSLSPGSETVRLLQDLPMDPRVRVSSIIGCLEGCDDPEHSSDGVVPYSSSHLDGVPETVIPSDHSGQNHPRCAEEVLRLLQEHLHP